MQIPDTYKVLFLQGGASLQFTMVPMNLMTGSKKADFIDTGVWSSKAIKEAKKFGKANVIASSKADHIFQLIKKSSLIKKQIMYISVRIIQFMELNLTHCLIQGMCL